MYRMNGAREYMSTLDLVNSSTALQEETF